MFRFVVCLNIILLIGFSVTDIDIEMTERFGEDIDGDETCERMW